MRTSNFGVLGLILITAVLSAWASINGSISGVVKDPTGAVIPNAEVSVTDLTTNVTQTVRTDDLGGYSFLSLPVGRYKLVLRAAGFVAYAETDIILNDNDKLRFDVTLKVGQPTQQVEVAASAVHTETANTQLGDVVQSRTMEALPLNGREFTNLLGLQPGVVPDQVTSQGNFFGSTAQGNVSIGGQRETSNGFLINGANADNPLNNGTTVIPNLDSIDEFRVLTANFDAEYGNYNGGLITVVTKPGTNQWHGDAFEFLRNEKMDSRGFYEYNQNDPATGLEIPGTARGAFKRNQFGGTLGGPLKRDRAFVFVDYQGTRQRRGQASGLILVPSPAESTGDFSAVAPSALTGTVGGPFFAGILSQELNYPVTANEPYYYPAVAPSPGNPGHPACTSATGPMPCVFPNGIIPQSAFSAPSKALKQYVPLPNAGPYYVTSANNVHTRDDRFGVRLDFQTERWGMLSAYYSFDDKAALTPFGTGSFPGFPTVDGGRSQLYSFGDTKSFGATALNELHLSFNRTVEHNGKPVGNYPVPLKSLGFAEGQPGGIVAATAQFEGAPDMGFNNFSFGLNAVAYNRYDDTPSVMDNFSKVKGRHTIKFGGQYVFNDFYEPMPLVGGNGFDFFNGVETGNDFADFLIGAEFLFVQEGGFWVDNRRNYSGLYAQDSWRARPDLTLNYGLRWDVLQPWYEKTLQSSTFVQGVTSTVYPGAPTGYVFPGDKVPGFGKIPNTLSRTPHDNFGPRVGFAYSPNFSEGLLHRLAGGSGNFSIRAGFGMFYTNVEGVTMLDETGLAPFDIFYVGFRPLFDRPYTNASDGGTHFIPFPFTPPPHGGTTAAFWNPLLPLSGYPVPEITATTPYSENYNFTLQRQFGNNTMLSIGYVGSQGHHLVASLANNPGNQALCLSLSQPNEVAPGTPTCGAGGAGGVYTRPDGTVVNSTRQPFGPNFGDNVWFATLANSGYNSLQTSLRHTTNRLTFFASYTYSKSLDNASSAGEGVNPVNPRLSRSLSPFDITHSFVVSYRYLLPFDRLAGNRRSRLTSGWELAGITRFATGYPIQMGESDDRSLITTTSAAGIDTPDFLGGDLKFTDPRSGKPYFNTSLFAPGQLGHFGTSNRRFFHGPGINNFDLSLQKELKLTEGKSLQFRGEFFNTFNHAQFFNPSGNINGNFGFVTSARDPRIGQVAIKFLF